MTIHKHLGTPARVVCCGPLHWVKSPETPEKARTVRAPCDNTPYVLVGYAPWRLWGDTAVIPPQGWPRESPHRRLPFRWCLFCWSGPWNAMGLLRCIAHWHLLLLPHATCTASQPPCPLNRPYVVHHNPPSSARAPCTHHRDALAFQQVGGRGPCWSYRPNAGVPPLHYPDPHAD